ncbi:MAG: DUF349 domain-containing protein [Burkholderiales bacterium]
MLDYFFKRSASPPASSEAAERETIAGLPPVRDKELALQQAKTLGGEESIAVEFIAQCPFADARLIAAENVHSKAMLERVLSAVRNTDRRVTKLMQARLDVLALEHYSEQQARQCIDRALKLADEPVLLPNQVVDLDHAWQLIGAQPESATLSAFGGARAVLGARLEAQAKLQRSVIDSLACLRELSAQASALAPSDVASVLDNIEQEMAQHLSCREAISLPKNLLSEFSVQQRQLKDSLSSLAERRQAIDARQALLQSWEDPAARAGLKEDALKRAWQALPALPDDLEAAALQLRFNALLQEVSAACSDQKTPSAEVNPGRAANLAEMLESMEHALQEGAVRAALEIDKLLRSPDRQRARLSREQTSHLAQMRSELSHLQGWAKWGGNISREELLKAAGELPGKALAAPELAKKVGSLRERWKSLDASAGSANKALWERFDAACTLAYAPAAAHFKKLADERQDNLHKAEAIVAEVRQFSATSPCVGDSAAADWKAIAVFCDRTVQLWHRLGSIDRKDKKRLDGEFHQIMQLLQQPLALQQQAEAARREILIAEILALNPGDRTALDTVRALQERWQQLAKALPLERKVEQALWQRFRAACDALFAKRKEAAASADAGRKSNLAEKENLCGKLESMHAESGQAIAKIARDAKDAWSKIGPVPRAEENRIESRFQAAVNALQKRLDADKQSAVDAELHTLLSKMRLCQALEQGLADAQKTTPATLDQWQGLPALPAEFERPLRERFDKALNALQAGDAQYRAALEENRSLLSQRLLRVEILAGVESPAELSRERLQMQVEVLQSKLKTGPVANKQDLLLDLCKMAALADQKTTGRIEQLIRKLKKA